METEQPFTRGPILSTLLKFALPVLLALLLVLPGCEPLNQALAAPA